VSRRLGVEYRRLEKRRAEVEVEQSSREEKSRVEQTSVVCALELVHHSDVFYSSVLQFYCLFQVRVCRSQWNGCVKVSQKVLGLQ